MDMQLNTRYMSQLEELEQMKGQLVLPRNRNLSSDRQQTNGVVVTEARSSRNSEKASQSVEKFLNLRQQNQNVDNLITSWKQQKTHSISINQGCSSVIHETPEHEDPKPSTFTNLIIEEEELAKPINQKLQIPGKVVKKQPTPVTLNRKNTLGARPQTSKVQPAVPPPQTPAQKKAIQPKNMKSSCELNEAQTPTQQKMKQSSLLEKTRQGKVQQVPGKPVKKNSDEEKQIILQLNKLKDSVIKLYEQRFEKTMAHSQTFIQKNFDQILNTMKLDFRCLENEI